MWRQGLLAAPVAALAVLLACWSSTPRPDIGRSIRQQHTATLGKNVVLLQRQEKLSKTRVHNPEEFADGLAIVSSEDQPGPALGMDEADGLGAVSKPLPERVTGPTSATKRASDLLPAAYRRLSALQHQQASAPEASAPEATQAAAAPEAAPAAAVPEAATAAAAPEAASAAAPAIPVAAPEAAPAPAVPVAAAAEVAPAVAPALLPADDPALPVAAEAAPAPAVPEPGAAPAAAPAAAIPEVEEVSAPVPAVTRAPAVLQVTTQPVLAPESEVVAASTEAILLGCFRDGNMHMFAGNGVRVGKDASTVDNCAEMCATFLFMALQDADQCTCANTYKSGDDYPQVANTECISNSQCSVENGCGGLLRNSIYQLGKAPPPPKPAPVVTDAPGEPFVVPIPPNPQAPPSQPASVPVGPPAPGGAKQHETAKQHAAPHPWTYKNPGQWGENNKACRGAEQSPIDIESSSIAEADSTGLTDLASRAKYVPVGPNAGLKIVNHGHNVQVNGAFGTLSLPDGDYAVKQFHFHFPSEHAVDGYLAAGEMHIVHQHVEATGTNRLAVIGVLLQEEDRMTGDFRHKDASVALQKEFFNALSFLPNKLPKAGQETALAANTVIDLARIFAPELKGKYFHYKGSLTTPPCSETVHWYVLQKPAVVDRKIINSFKALFPSPANNRPVQPLNGRAVVNSQLVASAGEFQNIQSAESRAEAAASRVEAAADLIVAEVGKLQNTHR